MKTSSLTWPTLLLFSLLPPAFPVTCTVKCEPGSVQHNCKCVPCPPEQYWYKRREARCEKCTSSCNEKLDNQEMNQVEVSPCHVRSNRQCHCKPGFYCPSPIESKCRRPCLPCQNGFLSEPSLNTFCKRYTDCAGLGMIAIEGGSAIKDRVCGKPPNTTILITKEDSKAVPSAFLSTLTLAAPTTKPAVGHQHTNRSFDNPATVTSLSIKPVLSNPRGETISSLPSYGNASVVLPTVSPLDGSVSPPEPLLKTTWLFVPLLVFILLALLCLCVRRKSKAVKSRLQWAGFAFGKYHPVDATKHPSQPQGSKEDKGSFPGGNQQVTMDVIGKGESINNTVGTVILGSKSNERKEESEASREASSQLDSDNEHPMIVPQQESSSQEDFISVSMQEELGKDLFSSSSHEQMKPH